MEQDARKIRKKETVFVMVVNGTSSKKKKNKRDCVCDGGEWNKQQVEKKKKRDCVCDGGE